MKYSHNDEQQYIQYLLSILNLRDNTYVDVGASDGIEMSNTYFLAQNNWNGLCVEYNPIKYESLINNYKEFHNIRYSNRKVTPNTILDILTNNTPNIFDFLNLDIDGYDYHILDKLLTKYTPKIICTEINEKIPPPIKFTVSYSDTYTWNDAPFFGQSIEMVQDLCNNHNYSIVNVEYNNVFLVTNTIKHNLKILNTKEAWTVGYYDKLDRKTKFHYNNHFEPIYNMTPIQGIDFINNQFIKHNGEYTIGL